MTDLTFLLRRSVQLHNEPATLFDQPVTEPIPGGVRHSDPTTSHAAAAVHMIHRGSQRHDLLSAYTVLGPATDEEAGAHVGLDHVRATRRLSELRNAGLIERTGSKRPTTSGCESCVCRITLAGMRALQEAQK